MKKQIYIMIGIAALLLAGCITEEPADGIGIDPTMVSVSTTVTLDPDLVPFEPQAAAQGKGVTEREDGYRRRFLVDVLREGTRVERHVLLPEAADGSQPIRLPVTLKLHALKYTLAVWSDYVEADSADAYYDTGNLSRVECTAPYTGSTGLRDALYGTAELDLTAHRDEWNAGTEAQVDMIRPLARYRIIATDTDDFLYKMRQRRKAQGRAADAGTEAYTVTFSYGYFLPTAFNVLTGKPCDSSTGVTFTTPLSVEKGEECPLGSDYIFVNGTESFVVLTIEVRDDTGEVVSRVRGLEVPYRRGMLTTVRGHFLTSEMAGGIEINTEFDGEIHVNI